MVRSGLSDASRWRHAQPRSPQRRDDLLLLLAVLAPRVASAAGACGRRAAAVCDCVLSDCAVCDCAVCDCANCFEGTPRATL